MSGKHSERKFPDVLCFIPQKSKSKYLSTSPWKNGFQLGQTIGIEEEVAKDVTKPSPMLMLTSSNTELTDSNTKT